MIAWSSKQAQSGTTIVETMVAAMLIAGFFGVIFEVNAVCLHYINASKESVAALQGVQDRLESFRNLLFTDLTSTTTANSPPNLMVNPANGSDLAKNVTEVVKLSAYPTPDATNTQVTRPPGASVTPTINSTDTNLANATLVKVNVTYTWSSTLGGRARSETTETIISAGSKK